MNLSGKRRWFGRIKKCKTLGIQKARQNQVRDRSDLFQRSKSRKVIYYKGFHIHEVFDFRLWGLAVFISAKGKMKGNGFMTETRRG